MTDLFAHTIVEKWSYMVFKKDVCIPLNNTFEKQQWAVVCTKKSLKRRRVSGWDEDKERHQLLTSGTQTDLEVNLDYWAKRAVYQFPCDAAVLQPNTRGSTRPLGSLWSGSRLCPHKPRPHKTLSPNHTYTPDRDLGSICDHGGGLCRPLCRNLCEEGQRLTSVCRGAFSQMVQSGCYIYCSSLVIHWL